MVLDFEYCYCVHWVNDTSSVIDHCEFFVGFRSARYDDWNWAVMSWHWDYRCRRLHCTEMFHIRSMLKSVADDDCSGQRFASNVVNDNVDGADCKFVHWFWYVEDWQSIRILSMFNFYSLDFFFIVLFCLSLLQCYFLVLHTQFSMWHTIKRFFVYFFGNTLTPNMYEVMNVRCKKKTHEILQPKKKENKKWNVNLQTLKIVLYDNVFN